MPVSPADIALVAAMLCGETRGLTEKVGANLATQERAAIVQTVVNRVRSGRYGGRTIRSVVLARKQYAAGCQARESARAEYVDVATAVLEGKIAPPKWALDVVAFALPRASRYVGPKWRRGGFVPIANTETVHVFWREG